MTPTSKRSNTASNLFYFCFHICSIFLFSRMLWTATCQNLRQRREAHCPLPFVRDDKSQKIREDFLIIFKERQACCWGKCNISISNIEAVRECTLSCEGYWESSSDRTLFFSPALKIKMGRILFNPKQMLLYLSGLVHARSIILHVTACRFCLTR